MKIKIGSAPDSWGVWFPDDPKQTPWNRFLDEVAEAGYEWTELGPAGYLPTDAAALRKELEKRRLKLCAGFVFEDFSDESKWPSAEQQIRAIGPALKALGAQYVILIQMVYTDLFTGKPLLQERLEGAAWKRLVDGIQKASRLIKKEYGLSTLVHPHAETTIEYEDQIERLLADTDPQLVNLCFDVGHHAYRHGDPVAFLRKHSKRIPYLHLKSVDAMKRDQVAREKIPFAVAVGQDMFTEPSAGAVDFPKLRDLLVELNFEGFGIVEQDMYPAPFDKPLPIARRTRAYLKQIGLG